MQEAEDGKQVVEQWVPEKNRETEESTRVKSIPITEAWKDSATGGNRHGRQGCTVDWLRAHM